MNHTATDTSTPARGRGLQVAAAVARSHLGPLGLVELATVLAALLAGWKLVALAILGFHLLRMGVVAFRASRRSANGARPRSTRSA